MPAAAKLEFAAPETVAFVEIVKAVALLMAVMNEPAGILPPLTGWPTTSPAVDATVTALLKAVVVAETPDWAGTNAAQPSAVAAVAPATAQPPRMPLVLAAALALMFVTEIWLAPVTEEPSAVPAKESVVPAERVRLPTVRLTLLPLAAAGAVRARTLEPCARVTPAPVEPRATAVDA